MNNITAVIVTSMLFTILIFVVTVLMLPYIRSSQVIANTAGDMVEGMAARVSKLEIRIGDQEGEIAILRRVINEYEDTLNENKKKIERLSRHVERLEAERDEYKRRLDEIESGRRSL